MFSLDQLRCFVAVAEEANFRKAAIALQMTQAPVSRQVQKLEHSVGVRLLSRDTRSVTLTPAGQALLVEAKILLAKADALPVSAQRVAQGLSGTVRVGFAPSAFSVLHGILTSVESELPSVQLVLQEMVTADQSLALERGELDIAVLRPPVDPERFDSRLLHKESFVLAVPADDPLAKAPGTLAIADLENSHLLMYSPAPPAYFYKLTASALVNVQPLSTQYITHVSTMVTMVNAGRGIALVPASAAELQMRNVVFRKLRGMEHELVELHLAWRRPVISPAALRVLDIFAKRATTPEILT